MATRPASGASEVSRILNPMTRIWRSTAGLLLGFMALDLAVLIYMATAGARLNAGTYLSGQQFAWTVLDAFLVWPSWCWACTGAGARTRQGSGCSTLPSS